ncbi:MAG: hypothetical protein U1E08_00550 [Coriobacteriia bacterium]|nr:hypothetical protein [Actinomycetota bacterium]MDZ4166176.1 hypothetical protein [Coriobacteriia bacterium]
MRRLPAIALIIAILMVGAVGCGGPDDMDDATSGDEVASSVVGTLSPDAEATPGDVTSSDPDSADGSGSTGGTSDTSAGGSEASAADTSAVLRELDAVRRELDAISLPDDTDFSDIEAALQ